MTNSKLILIDGNALVHRAFHALPPLTSPKGQITNAVFGFCSILLKILKDFKPEYVAATFDMAAPTFRHNEFAEYKAKRVKAPQELYDQIPLVKQVLEAFGIPVFENPGYEADDLIGTLAEKIRATKGVQIIIATGDLDTLQLVEDKKVVVFTLRKGMSDTVIYDESAVVERYGLKPSQLSDYRGLKGDPSDNIPGVPGIGDKTAGQLIKDFENLEKLYQALESGKADSISKGLQEKLIANKEQAFFSKQLSVIVRDVPVEFSLKKAQWRNHIDIQKLGTLFADFGFKSLDKRLAEIDLVDLEVKPLSREVSPLSLEKQFADLGMQKIYETIEKPLTPVLIDMQKWGIKIDVPMLKKLLEKTSAELADLEGNIFKQAGSQFNINSPNQLATILYDKLEIKGRVRKTAGGSRSTAAPELEKLRDEHAIIDMVLQYRELQKLKTTYIEPFPSLVSPDGRIHTTYDQMGAATGRLSSSNPNLQNIPIRTALGQEFRKAFVAEEGFQLVSADYSQIELRIVAHLAGDKKMIDAFRKGEDIHTRTASEIFEVTPAQVTKDMRRQAKVLNFGVLYGMGFLGVARAAGVSREQGKQFIEKYFAEFSGVAEYIENTKKQAYELGYVETLFGRRRTIPEIQSTMPQLRSAGERMAVNMPIQGTAADLIKMAMVKVYEFLEEDRGARMLLQVHDELLFEIKDSEIERLVKPIKKIMEEVHIFKVPIVVDIKTGPNWRDMKPYA